MSFVNEIMPGETAPLQAQPVVSPSPPPALPNPTRHVPALDGLRGLAVIAVILVHCGALAYGGAGVDVFFVLSGYLITAILIREKEQTGTVSFKNFYIRRWLRLAPAFFFMICLYLVLARITNQSMRYALGDVGIALGYASNWTRAFGVRPDYLGHTWSLSVEEQFYLLWPALALAAWWVLRRRWVTSLFFFAAALGVMHYRDRMMLHSTTARVYNGLDTRADSLLVGAALAFWMPQIGRVLSTIIGWLSAITLAAFMTQVSLLQYLADHFGTTRLPQGSYVLPVVCTAGMIVGIMEARGSILDRFLGFGPFAWVGRISYGLYLFHFPWITFLERNHFPQWWVVSSGISAAFGFAILSYYWIEMPCLRLKDRFRPRQGDSIAGMTKLVAA